MQRHLLLLAAIAFLPSRALALNFDFAKIMDINTPVPGSGGSFSSITVINSPDIDGYNVAFRANLSAPGTSGIYTSLGGVLAKAVDTTSGIPFGSGTFTSFGDPSLSGGNVAFTGAGSSQQGVYTTISGMTRIADLNTAIPSGGSGNFTNFGSGVSLDADNVAFEGAGASGQVGVFSTIGGTLHAVANQATAIPGGTGNFTGFGGSVSLNQTNIAFVGTGTAGQSGIYTDVGGTLHPVADIHTAIPGGTGNFTSFFSSVALNNGNVQFVGFGTGSQWGIYNDVGGTLHLIADKNTPIPNGTGNFTSFNSSYTPGLNNGNSIFEGAGAGQDGSYTDIGGTLTTVANKSTMIDGKSVFSFSPGVGPQGLSNGNIAAYVQFISAAAGVYVAEQSYDYAANASGAWDTASNWSFGLKPRTVVYTNIHPDNGVLITGPASATTIRGLDLGANLSGVAELRLQATGQLTVNEYLYVETLGKLNLNGSVATANYGLYNYGDIDLGSGGQLSGGVFFNNNSGTLHGSGTVGNYLYNYGHIQAINSQMLFTAPATNGVVIDQNNQPVAIGQIEARNALLQFNAGLSNQGQFNFSFGTSDVFGAINNVAADPIGHTPGGQIIISGNSNVTFYDAVVQNGDVFRISTGSTAIFFGPVSGAGAFTGGGAKIFEGGYSPGNSPATVSLDGPVTLGDTNTLKIELGGTTPGTQYDQVHVMGQLTLGGALQISLINPGTFTPAAHEKFDILDWGALGGSFASLSLPALASPLAWNTSQLYTTGVISIIDSNYLPGDINRDGKVTVADISALMVALSDLNTYQSSHPGMSDPQNLLQVADVNGDGAVNNADLQALISIVANNPAGGGALTSVPEPASLILLALVLPAVVACGRQRQ